MIENYIWKAAVKRLDGAYQPRNRRECFSELTHIDGLHHSWFEEPSSKYAILVYVDNGTGN